MNSKALDYTALIITVIGAVNWGLIGIFRFNLVSFLFGDMTWISRMFFHARCRIIRKPGSYPLRFPEDRIHFWKC